MSRLQELKEMDKLPDLTKPPITQVQLVKYAGASGDYNRIHIDKEFADNTPLNGVIAHGMLSMGFLGQYIDQLSNQELNVEKFKVRFRAMVRVGDEITCESQISSSNDYSITLDVNARNQNDEDVIVGEVTLAE